MRIREVFEKTQGWLVDEGKSRYTIVLPDEPDEYERKASEELNFLLSKATKVTLPVTNEGRAPATYRIYLGKVAALADFNVDIRVKTAGSDGFYIQSRGEDLLIVGKQRGTLFGVYGFFERALHYRYYAEGEIKLDEVNSLPFYTADIFEKPDIDARSFGYYDTFHLEVPAVEKNCDRLRVGRNNYSDWVYAGHSYFTILPKAQYQAAYPDWYSPDGANLCLTAEGIVEEFTANVIKMVEKTSGRYFMIGQEDNFAFCNCERCQKAIAKHGGAGAVMMRFSNEVAKGVEAWLQKNQPERDLKLVTFAYNATATPPVRYDEGSGKFLPLDNEVVARDNLAVMFVPFGTLHNYPYEHSKNKKQYDGFMGWSACAKSIFVWDYCANFDNFLVEFHDYNVIQPNYDFFRRCNVEFLFDQGPYCTRTPCFDDLKLFLRANLAWDTAQSAERLTDEFMNAYYKEIAPYMQAYLRRMQERWEYIFQNLGEEMRSGGCDSSYYLLPEFFPKEFLDDCMELFRDARGALEKIRIDEWDKYVLLKQRLNKITLSVRFLLVKMYGRYYGKELAKKVDILRAEMTAAGIVKTNEGDFMEIC